jgi:hypothetical protein
MPNSFVFPSELGRQSKEPDLNEREASCGNASIASVTIHQIIVQVVMRARFQQCFYVLRFYVKSQVVNKEAVNGFVVFGRRFRFKPFFFIQ